MKNGKRTTIVSIRKVEWGRSVGVRGEGRGDDKNQHPTYMKSVVSVCALQRARQVAQVGSNFFSTYNICFVTKIFSFFVRKVSCLLRVTYIIKHT